MNERTPKEKEKLKELKKGAAIQELRLYIKDGKIVHVEPIDPEKYSTDHLKDLSKEKIRWATTVLVSQENPTCTYWYYYWTGAGWEKICLIWE